MAETRESIISRFLVIAGMTSTEEECYKAGFDAGMNGANSENSHFRHFRSKERMRAWERGQHAGNQARKAVESNVPKRRHAQGPKSDGPEA